MPIVSTMIKKTIHSNIKLTNIENKNIFLTTCLDSD